MTITKETIAAALADLEKLRASHVPTEADLANAPLLEGWIMAVSGVLIAQVSGHPSLSDGLITTSLVLALDRKAGWARTASRYYSNDNDALRQLDGFLQHMRPMLAEFHAIVDRAFVDDPVMRGWRATRTGRAVSTGAG